MLKQFNQKNKKTRFLVWMSGICALACLAAYILYPSVNIYLLSNTFPFLSQSPKVRTAAPFYGENIDMSQLLPTSQHYIVNRKGKDLIDIAADLGINMIRITNTRRSFHNNADSIYTQKQWDTVLDKMQSKGIKALLLIEVSSSNKNYYTPDIRPAYLHLVQEYINSGVFSHPTVYAVDIKNEPLLTGMNVTMLQAAHDMIKAKYPNLKQTIGWWASTSSPKDPHNLNNYNWSDFSAGKKIAGIVDFYSIHIYELDTDKFGVNIGASEKTKMFLSGVQNGLQTKKPIMIEEFGEANGDAVSDQDTIGSPELQANIYQGFYQALQEMHSSQVIGSVAFDFYSRNQYPDAWAIIKNNGDTLLPAACVLQHYATGKNTSSCPTTTTVTSQSYLVANADNHTTKNLQLSDRIGLKLQLAEGKHYSLSLSRPGMLQSAEPFYYDPTLNAYQAVFKAIGSGSVQVDVIPTDTISTSPIYTVTVVIQ